MPKVYFWCLVKFRYTLVRATRLKNPFIAVVLPQVICQSDEILRSAVITFTAECMWGRE
jgi:hypothetical protein